MDIVLALLQGGRAVATGYVLLMILIVILAILLALIAVLQIVLIVRMGTSSGRGEPSAGATGMGSAPPRAGEAPPTAGVAEEEPTREVPGRPEVPPGEPPPTR